MTLHRPAYLAFPIIPLLLSIPTSAAVPPADLRAHVEFLASDLLEGRDTPSRGLDLAASYIAAQFRRAGLRPLADGSFIQAESSGHVNVIGVLPGSEPSLSDSYVLVTAHYDHLGLKSGGEEDAICNGANDNASGVASLIEVADVLTTGRLRPRRTLVFIAFYGEEKGLVGSRYYAANPVFPIAQTVAQINLEQTGRTDDSEGANAKTLNVTGFDYSEVAAILRTAAEPKGIAVKQRPKWSDGAFERSDNEALAKKGVPAHTVSVAYMFPDYHRPNDDWDKLDYENMAAVTDAVAAGVLAIANRPEPPHWYIGAPYGRDTATALSKPIPRTAAHPAASSPKSVKSRATRARRQSTQSKRP